MIWEERAYKKSSRIKYQILKPICKILGELGITPNMVSYSSVVLMLLFLYFIKDNIMTSTVLLILALFMDLVDGALSKYLKMESDKGKFTDKLMDSVVFALFIVGMVFAGFIDGITGVLLAYFWFLCDLLLIIKKNIKKKSNWVIRPVAGFFPTFLRDVVYILFFIYVFLDKNYFYPLVWIIAGLYILKSIQVYFVIRNTVLK